jgi:hypothetical protein
MTTRSPEDLFIDPEWFDPARHWRLCEQPERPITDDGAHLHYDCAGCRLGLEAAVRQGIVLPGQLERYDLLSLEWRVFT